MRLQESLDVVMVADHVEIEKSMIRCEDQTQGESVATFIEPVPEGSDAAPTMRMGVAQGIAHGLDQLTDLLPIRLRENTESSQ